METHQDICERQKLKCDICEFQSVSKISLRAHKRTKHLGDRKIYICHCGKNFNQNSHLHIHIKMVHEKLRKHPCSQCTKAFYFKSQLTNHLKSEHVSKN